MSTQGYLLGIDLGTSNTVAVLRRPDGQSRPLLLDGNPVMASGVLLDAEGHIHVGRDASRMAMLDPAGFEPHPKRRIAEGTIRLGHRDIAVVDLLAGILAAVARAAVEAVGFLPPVVMTHPAAWDDGRKQALRDAAARAGFPPVALVPEPVAAARYFTDVMRRPVPLGGSVAVFDFGGGTLDVAVLRREPNGFVLIGSGGDNDLGGLDVDTAMAHHLANSDGGQHPEIWQALAQPRDEHQRRARRMFWDDIRGAKEMLSRSGSAPVGVPGLNTPATVTRDDLDRASAPLIAAAIQATARVLQQAGIRPSDLAGLFLVGGASRLPAVARELHGALHIAPTVIEQPEIPVAEGAIAQVAPQLDHAPQSGPPAPVPLAAPAAPVPLFRRRMTWIAAAVAVFVLAGAGTAIALVARDNGKGTASGNPKASTSAKPAPPKFKPLAAVGQPIPADPASPIDSFYTLIRGDTAVIATENGKTMSLTSVEVSTGTTLWKAQLTTDRDSFVAFRAFGNKIMAIASNKEPGPDSKDQLTIANADNGKMLWQTDMALDGKIIPTKEATILLSDEASTAIAYNPDNGQQLWQRSGQNTYGKLFSPTPTSELAIPASGVALQWDYDLDKRTTLVDAAGDGVMKLVDPNTGRTTQQFAGAISPSSAKLYADENHVFIGEDGGAIATSKYRIRSFDMKNPKAQPQLLYTSPDVREIVQMKVCFGDLLCLLDQSGIRKNVQLVVVDPKTRKALWTKAAPDTDNITQIGDHLLVFDDAEDPNSFLFDRTGKQLFNSDQQDQYAVRTSPTSLITFAKPIDNRRVIDETIRGVDATTGKFTDLGGIRNVVNGACSWNERYLICPVQPLKEKPTENEFRIWQFAE